MVEKVEMAQDDLQAARLRKEGVARYQEGDLKGAVERLEESARLFAEDGQVVGQAEALGDLGAVLMKGSQPPCIIVGNRIINCLNAPKIHGV